MTDLLRYEKIRTTEAKAKEVQPMAEKMITLGKDGSLHARRQAISFVTDPNVVKKVFDEIGPRYADRHRRLHPHRQAGPPFGRRRRCRPA